jgi:hypothetical protein
MDHCFKWPAHRAIEHIAAAKLNRVREVLILARVFIRRALGKKYDRFRPLRAITTSHVSRMESIGWADIWPPDLFE